MGRREPAGQRSRLVLVAKTRWRAPLSILVGLSFLVACAVPLSSARPATARPERAKRIATAIRPRLEAELRDQGLAWGSPVFMRIFKQEAVLELFVRKADRYLLFRSYPICAFSGDLGPKTAEGDNQAPEGFYSVSTGRLNPASSYHLALNLGYPNTYDRAHDRTGDFLMVHGDCVSIGCYAMTDYGIEEIYTLSAAALNNGQPSVSVHAFPFRFKPGWRERARRDPQHVRWLSFWSNLETGYRAFETTHVPPRVSVSDQTYRFA
jgi:murein L,D-transpeptidase YafK